MPNVRLTDRRWIILHHTILVPRVHGRRILLDDNYLGHLASSEKDTSLIVVASNEMTLLLSHYAPQHGG